MKDGRGLRKFIKETLHATAGEAQTNHTQILSIGLFPDSKDVIMYIQKMSSKFNFSGKISHDLLGSVEIPLKNIPASGVCTFWKINVFFVDKRQIYSCQ